MNELTVWARNMSERDFAYEMQGAFGKKSEDPNHFWAHSPDERRALKIEYKRRINL